MTDDAANSTPAPAGPRLCDADCRVIDALVANGFRAESPEGEDRVRAQRLVALLSMLDRYPFEATDSQQIVAATMSRIRAQSRPLSFPAVATDRDLTNLSWRARAASQWRNVLTAAAALLVLSSVLVPMLGNLRRSSMQQSCLAGLGQVALALTNYSESYGNSLPVRYDSAPHGNWLESRINSANLFYLARAGYATFDQLTCPGNPYAADQKQLDALDNWPSSKATSFSFQNVLTIRRARWATAPTMVIIADKSPIVEAARDGRAIDVATPSSSHRRPRWAVLSQGGQNSLLSDGSGLWLTSPMFGNDNIWLPDSCQDRETRLVGYEMPGCEFDSMLIH